MGPGLPGISISIIIKWHIHGFILMWKIVLKYLFFPFNYILVFNLFFLCLNIVNHHGKTVPQLPQSSSLIIRSIFPIWATVKQSSAGNDWMAPYNLVFSLKSTFMRKEAFNVIKLVLNKRIGKWPNDKIIMISFISKHYLSI